jgi:hypothetical protein
MEKFKICINCLIQLNSNTLYYVIYSISTEFNNMVQESPELIRYSHKNRSVK